MRSRIRRHPLGAFYGITFLVSWGYWVAMLSQVAGGATLRDSSGQ